jgi:hypothetical protein
MDATDATEETLKRMAQEILDLSDDELLKLLPKYQKRLTEYASMAEWQEAVLIYFLINATRVRKIQYPEAYNKLLHAKNGQDSPFLPLRPQDSASPEPVKTKASRKSPPFDKSDAAPSADAGDHEEKKPSVKRPLPDLSLVK